MLENCGYRLRPRWSRCRLPLSKLKQRGFSFCRFATPALQRFRGTQRSSRTNYLNVPFGHELRGVVCDCQFLHALIYSAAPLPVNVAKWVDCETNAEANKIRA